MPATTWLPYREFDEKREWLLQDGTVLTEPRMEQTNAGRRVRVPLVGLSDYSRNADDLLLRAVTRMAADRNTALWMPLTGLKEDLIDELGYDPEETRAALYTLDTKDLTVRTRVWFKFAHRDLPIEAVLSIDAGRTWPVRASSKHKVTTALVTPSTRPQRALDGSAMRILDSSWFEGLDHTPDWAEDLGEVTFTTEAPMIQHLLFLVSQMEDLASIQIPDLRDPDKPGWLELEFVESNLNGDFMSDLTEFMDGKPLVEQALEHFGRLRETLRGLGVVMDDMTSDDFSRGLLSGSLEVGVGVVRKTEDDADDHHTLLMDLSTGTFVVNCSLSINQGDAAYAWKEAKAIASLTGEEPELLAFARETARRENAERARGIIKARRKAVRRT